MIELTTENVLDALEKAVEEKGESFVYSNQDGVSSRNKFGSSSGIMCHYVHWNDRTPVSGCIAGNVLHRLGVSLDTLSEHEKRPIRSVLEDFEDEGIVTFEDGYKVTMMLSHAQGAQDGGKTWGDALKAAKNMI